MYLIEFEIFSCVEWAFKKGKLISTNKESCLLNLEDIFPLRNRINPFTKKDSLKIINELEQDYIYLGSE